MAKVPKNPAFSAGGGLPAAPPFFLRRGGLLRWCAQIGPYGQMIGRARGEGAVVYAEVHCLKRGTVHDPVEPPERALAVKAAAAIEQREVACELLQAAAIGCKLCLQNLSKVKDLGAIGSHPGSKL